MKDEGSMSPSQCIEGPPTIFPSNSTLEDDLSNFDTLYPPLDLPYSLVPSNPTDHFSGWQTGTPGHTQPPYASDSLDTFSSTQTPQVLSPLICVFLVTHRYDRLYILPLLARHPTCGLIHLLM